MQPFHNENPGVALPPHAQNQSATQVAAAATFKVSSHFHPFVAELLSRLTQGGVAALEAADTELKAGSATVAKLFDDQFFSNYGPVAKFVKQAPVKELEFQRGAYAVYNEELFFEIPMFFAEQFLSRGLTAPARRCLRFVCDAEGISEPLPQGFWKYRPFRTADLSSTEEVLLNLSTGVDPTLQADTISAIEEWRKNPFSPFAAAAFQPRKHMLRAVFLSMDIDLFEADRCFMMGTPESVDAAVPYLVRVANLLGPLAQGLPRKGSTKPQTYATLKAKKLDPLGNVAVELETDVLYDTMPAGGQSSPLDPQVKALQTLYFGVPRNEKLLGYWARVADRLFKIRNSLDINGVFRQLPLFAPPIDPAVLARAAAAGVDLAGVVSGLNQPLPLVRCLSTLRTATEFCQFIKSDQVLSLREKEEGEMLSELRSRHERALLEFGEATRVAQLHEAVKARDALVSSLQLAVERYRYYERQLGRADDDIKIPGLDDLDLEAIADEKARLSEPTVDAPRSISISVVDKDLSINAHEQEEMSALERAHQNQKSAASQERVASVLAGIPDFEAASKPMGAGAAIHMGGTLLSTGVGYLASLDRSTAEQHTYDASRAARRSVYQRRAQEWALQSNLALQDIIQNYKQTRAAQIREHIADRELESHRRQMTNAQQMDAFLHGEHVPDIGQRANTKARYALLRQSAYAFLVRGFQLALEQARKAERTLQHELGEAEARFLADDYLSGPDAFLAGERLALDLKRMEAAYRDLSRREYELTRHFCLSELDPKALLRLRATGECTLTIPETVLDLDTPGHFFRRIRSLAVSLPAVTGPYLSPSCSVSMTRSSVRSSTVTDPDGYARTGPEDRRFSDYYGRIESMVTSTGLNDTGTFQTAPGDLYTVFELSGAICQLNLKLPSAVRLFDYDTLADVIFHLRYTAREGGELLRSRSTAALLEAIAEGSAPGCSRLFSARRDFPDRWHAFTRSNLGQGRAKLALNLEEEHYPYWARNMQKESLRVDVHVRTARGLDSSLMVFTSSDGSEAGVALLPLQGSSEVREGSLVDAESVAPVGELKLFFETTEIEEVWIVLNWSGTPTP